jgi:hypothetical protein
MAVAGLPKGAVPWGNFTIHVPRPKVVRIAAVIAALASVAAVSTLFFFSKDSTQ